MNFVTSKYLQINDWCLVEYEYSTMSPKFLQYPTTGVDSIGIYKITNKLTGEYHFVNKSDNIGSIHKTGNSLAWNLIPVVSTQSKWATSNIIDDTIFNPIDNPNYIVEDVSASINDNLINYDTIRVHVLSGYNFEGIDGFILNVSFLENSKKKMKASCGYYPRDGAYKNGDLASPVFNPNPIVLGERTYDKYITICVPSLFKIQEESNLHPGNASLFSKIYSHPAIVDNPNPGEFVKDSTIYITLVEILSKETVRNVEFFTLKQTYDATIVPSDTYSSLGCTIKESEIGDYFEYYPSYQDGFINDYIGLLNANLGNGANWSVVNNIKVIEQVGTEFFTTTNITMPQSTGFDAASYFRPIIQYADVAFAYSLLYTMRLINGATGEQIIRVCNITLYNPKKYGLNTNRIIIDSGIAPMKVYNKVVNMSTIQNNQPVRSNNMFTVKYIPMYVNQNSIAVNMNDSIAKQMNDVIYGQGKCVIQLTNFDNVISFYVQNVTKTGILPMNLSGTNVYLKFILDNTQVISISPTISEDNHPQNGELVFQILKEDVLKILKNKIDNNFYLISKQDDASLETVIYKGRFEKFTEGRDLDKEMVKPLTIKLQEEQTKIDNLLAENTALRDSLSAEIANYQRLNAELLKKIAEYNTLIENNKNDLPTGTITTQPTQATIPPVSKSGDYASIINPVKFIVPVSIQGQLTQYSTEKISYDLEKDITIKPVNNKPGATNNSNSNSTSFGGNAKPGASKNP
jgi:hypothetical protein